MQRYFALAWVLTGMVSALGGVIWGAMLGVDNQLPLVGLKVFPVVIPGRPRFDRGGRVGGLIVGVVEALAAGYLDPVVGGGTKDFAPDALMIFSCLMVRPYGLFGCWCIASACDVLPRSRRVQDCRPAADMALMPLPNTRWAAVAFAVLFIGITPAVADAYTLSIGHGAFMSVGAYTAPS